MKTPPTCLVLACLVVGTVNGETPEPRYVKNDCYSKAIWKSVATGVKPSGVVVDGQESLAVERNAQFRNCDSTILRHGQVVPSMALHRTFDYFWEAHDARFPLGTCAFLCSSTAMTHVESEISVGFADHERNEPKKQLAIG